MPPHALLAQQSVIQAVRQASRELGSEARKVAPTWQVGSHDEDACPVVREAIVPGVGHLNAPQLGLLWAGRWGFNQVDREVLGA